MGTETAKLSLGIEEEYQLVHPVTRELRPRAKRVMTESHPDRSDDIQHELRLSQIETASQICDGLDDVRRELVRLRTETVVATEHADAHLVAAGTHPFSHWEEQPFTPQKRYGKLADDFQQLAREQVIFGCHVHVGSSDREMSVQILNRSREWLGSLLALSASSPFWLSEDTGYASFRTNIWIRWPLAGPPYSFSSHSEYRQVVQSLVDAEVIEDETKVYWDIRIPARLPTVEFRIADVCTTIDEAVMIAGLIQGLARTAVREVEADMPSRDARPEIVRTAHWHAARYGLSKTLVDVRSAKAIPAEKHIEQFLEELRPALEELGTWSEVSRLVHQTLANGNSAMRQRKVYEKTHRFEDVIDHLVEETRLGIDD
ncbi:carboxylate-amine ligase [Thalassoroseus pseudoceratinae]|uniref:carboxylate-amine ligase n=1 Tax=Thalassoroseus pseudoceratinae TaxID=2713176 RepID=UPI00141E7EBF|nr:carboxylate-amine ligase [Thalassoroseus pseudoceratinae]